MANDPQGQLQQFADALRRDSNPGPVTLNAAYIQANGPTPPPGLDAALTAAFRIPAAAGGLAVSFSAGDVGPITDLSFTVTNATLAQDFLGLTQGQTGVKLTFSLPGDVLQVQVEAAMLNDWTFSTFFTYMTGWPFTLLVLNNPTFVFTTVEQDYQWSGTTIHILEGQNFTSVLNVPQQFQPIFALVQGLGAVPATLPFFGPITLDKADNEKILYPDMDLKGVINNNSITVYFLKAYAPSIGFQIATVYEPVDPEELVYNADGTLSDEEEEPMQTPALFFGAKFDISLDVPAGQITGDQATLTLALQSQLLQSGRQYNFAIIVDPVSDVRLTPMTVASMLMGGNSFFQYVPPPLQAFLTTIGLEGLSLSGPLLPSPGVTSVGVSLGSKAGQPLTLFGDPTNGAIFTITSIVLDWTILNPLVPAKLQNLVSFTTTFTLFPDVFQQADCKTNGGEFMVSIDQDFNIEAAFAGCVSMDTLLRKVTKGAIGMPAGISISFSDVLLSINPSAKSYSFGFTFDATLDFITWDGKPLIQFQGMEFKLAASTPTNPPKGSTGTTVYRGSISGVVGVGPIVVNTLVEYDGTKTPSVWTLQTSLAEPLSLTDLVNQFFKFITGDYQFPSFLPGDLVVESFSVDATIPTASGPPPQSLSAPRVPGTAIAVADANKPTYKVAGVVTWKYDGLPGLPIETKAEIGLAYDGNKPGQEFSGSVIGTIVLTFPYLSSTVRLELMVGYRFGPATDDAKELGISMEELAKSLGDSAHLLSEAEVPTSQVLWIQWMGIRSTYDITNQTVTFTLNGWTVGSLIQSLVRLIGDPYFTLDSPWDLLNKIPLDGLSLTYDMKPNVANRVTAKYSLPSPIDFGFMKINGLKFQLVEGKVTIAIDGTISVPGMQNSPLFKPDGPGQDVQNMPNVPGQGNELFDLRLLALGQRVGIVGSSTFDSTQAVIKALEKVPSTNTQSNPVNPTSLEPGQPYYLASNNWLIAADFGILRVGTIYTFDCMIVFNDPNLYGLRLECNGEKAKVFAGLVIDILYKKITDDIGLYQIDFSFPSVLRNLNFGAFSIVLPSIRIQIYTNGDFFFDFGFPYNLDFSRSFTVMAIVYGVPVLGSAGFYFGKLSNATATGLPPTTKGTFDPVIVFGFGAQLGVGYYFEKGPLKAGFSITIFGIIEGMFAAWHPYDASGTPANNGEVQGNYYFKLKGSFGIIGKLYGSVDFAIIKADVELIVQVVAQVSYESFRKIPLSLSAHVSVKVSLKINLGLFSFTISFSFAITITAELTIGSDGVAPWDGGSTKSLRSRRMRSLPPLSVRRRLLAHTPATLRFKPTVRLAADAAPPTLTLVPAPQFSVMVPNVNSTSLADQQGAFIFLFAMDAPTVDGSGNTDGSSFQSLCQYLLPWVIDSLLHPEGEVAMLDSASEVVVTKLQLQEIIDALANNENPPLTYANIIPFLQNTFTVNVKPGDTGVKAGATVFPPFTGLSFTVPKQSGTGTTTIALGKYTTVTEAYRAEIAAIFRQLAARVEDENGRAPRAERMLDETPEPLAQFVFEDYFLLVARQLVQASVDAMDDYAYVLRPNDSLTTILAWLKERGNVDLQGNDHMIVQDIATPNLTHALSANKPLSLEGLTYTLQKDNSLTTVAARYTDPAASNKRWQTTPASIIIANALFSTMIAPGVEITVTVKTKPVKYVTLPGDSFQSIATSVGLSLQELADQSSLYGMTNLLVPSVTITIPSIAYTTGAGDTLQGIMTTFGMTLDAIIDVPANQAVPDFFDANANATIQIADLNSLYVSDLWSVIVRGDQVAQTAGMAARYPLHGVRLPNDTGLGLSPDFLYPTGQPDYGLYQLTGQEFPTPPLTGAAYGITLDKDTTLSWLEFNGSKTTLTLPIDLTKQAGDLKVVLDYARANGYQPNPTLGIQPDVNVTAKRTSAQNVSMWSTSGQAEVAAVTAPAGLYAAAMEAADSGPQIQPMVWQMPDTLLREGEARQAALTGAGISAIDSQKYLTVLEPQIGTTDPATRLTRFDPFINYAFSTRIDFQVKRLAQAADLEPQNPFANNVVPPSSGNAGDPAQLLAPYNYELIGPGPSDAMLLQSLLTAMDSIGQEIVSGLFILYPDNPAAPTGLVSRASSEFLSFITQTNLSTTTNPPAAPMALFAASGSQPRGIAQSPGEFIKLMWELSTVRSGGYYLYYEMVGSDAGLPDNLFDSSGIATLTLVISYNRAKEPANGSMLTNFTNAFITTDPIDLNRAVVSLESRSHASTITGRTGNESLQDLSDIFGANIGTLVALNPTLPIVTGTGIPISGVVRQVTPQDIAGGDVLTAFVKHYNAGAAVPITVAQLTAYNPGVPVALYSVFRFPPITYNVSTAAGGPGNLFPGLSDYYGLSLDALAKLAALVPKIFAANATINTDSEDFDAQPALGIGNVAVELSRVNLGDPPDLPPNPTQPQKDAFAQAYLFSLYQLLTAGFFGNAFFRNSPPGLSFGPRKSVPSSEAAQLRRPETRRALMAAQANDPFLYGQALGYSTAYALVNAAPDNTGTPSLPQRSANPYIAVGSLSQINLGWVDVFGNRTVTPFSAPPAGYTGPLNNPFSAVDYVDRLISVDKWPNVRTYYTYGGTPGSPQFQLTMQLNTAAYEPTSGDTKPCQNPPGNDMPQWQQGAVNDLEAFTRVYYQLNQNYDSLGIPGLTGNAVSMWLRNSILTAPDGELSAANQAAVRTFVSQCVQYVYNRAHCSAGGTQPTLTLTVDVPIASVSAQNILQMDAAIMLRRKPELCDPALRVLPDGLEVVSGVRPLMDAPAQAPVIPPVTDGNETVPPPQDLSAFAAAVEKVFITSDWQFRVGTGAAMPDQPRTTSSVTVWAVRMGRKPGAGLTYTIGSTPSYYAPMPVATELRTDALQLNQYSTGKPYPDGKTPTITFTGVDMNVWSNSALTAIDTFLSPTFASPAFILDNLLFTDPEKDGYVTRILKAKRKLADAIASTVSPILVTSASDSDTKKAAQEEMRQALLNRLSNAYLVTAVTVLPVTNASTNQPDTPGNVASPRFFGQPQGSTPKGLLESGALGSEQNYSISSGKVPLTPAGGSGDTRLAFLFSSKNVTRQPYVTLDLSYAMTHLEFNIRHVPGIDDYEQSSWITFVNGPFMSPIENGAEIPVVLRALPTPPTVTTQTATAQNTTLLGQAMLLEGASSPSDLAVWDYGFSYVYLGSAQDSVRTTVEFNLTPSMRKALFADPSADLFAALAQFVTVYPAIEEDMITYLRVVNANSKPADVTNAEYAVQAFTAITEGVADAYKAWADSKTALAMPAIPQQVTFVFDIVLSDDNGEARIDIFKVSLQPDGVNVPVPVVIVEPDKYQWEVAPDPPPGALVSYRYKLKASGNEDSYLPYEDALSIPQRAVALPGLNLFQFQNGWSGVQVVRNQFLVPGVATTDTFRFSTPLVQFSDPIVPLLEYDSYNLGTVPPTAQTLEGYLDAFFESLFSGAVGQQVAAKMTSAFSYLLIPSLPLTPRTLVPVSLLPPTMTTPEAGRPPAFVAPFAASVTTWMKDNQPVLNGTSQVNMQLTVFAALTADPNQQQPLLTIRDLYIDANSVKP
ncbi:MAG TPA: peptidoglycan-binding protein [Candidatus Kapabacteria bacterium]|nr:peptidoglycan-binding protein [Candidatus Kapabacteria bacterium]